MSKELVYFVIGGDPKYVKLLEFCINSIRNYNTTDILVMTDKNYASYLKNLPITHLHITPENKTADQVSMRKVEIFSVPVLSNYEKILYLDCDIAVTGSLMPIFDILKSNDKIYVLKENFGKEEKVYNSEFWHCRKAPHSLETIKYFIENNVYVFSAGQFAFRNSLEIKTHFDNVIKEIQKGYDRKIHFYEQSFMNDYFNQNLSALYELNKFCKLSFVSSGNVEPPDHNVIVTHFCNAMAPHTQKFDKMTQFYKFHIADSLANVTRIETRDKIDDIIKLPQESVIAEVGVLKGEFSRLLIDKYRPKRMIMIDPWQGSIGSGDKNGNNFATYQADDLYKFVFENFSNLAEIHRKCFHELTVETSKLDLIYLDGDHSYQGTLRDLELSYQWVKTGGWICGHDFDTNLQKTTNKYDFGVRQAVIDFCAKYGLIIKILMMDGCVSFGIQK